MSAIEAKYGAITAENKQFHDGEPVFLLRATDPLAVAAVLHYSRLCADAGCDDAHVSGSRFAAKIIAIWQKDNPKLVKPIPD